MRTRTYRTGYAPEIVVDDATHNARAYVSKTNAIFVFKREHYNSHANFSLTAVGNVQRYLYYVPKKDAGEPLQKMHCSCACAAFRTLITWHRYTKQ